MSFDRIHATATEFRANLSTHPVHYYDSAPPVAVRLAVEAHNPRLVELIAFFDAAIADGEPRFPWGHQPCFREDGETTDEALMRIVRERRQEAIDALLVARAAWIDAGSPMPEGVSVSGTTLREMLEAM